MKVVALISGGKDSTYNQLLCQKHGHQVLALANLYPSNSQTNELDSYMFQTAAHQLISHYSACTGLPLYRKQISPNTSIRQSLGYLPTQHDEVEDLFQLLKFVKLKHPEIDAVSSGAIASDYQRLRVENVCQRLGLISLAYLWHQPQQKLLRGMVQEGVGAVLVKVAALGLGPQTFLGKGIGEIYERLLELREKFGINVCGEGGEYETVTLNCSAVFKFGKIVVDEWKMEVQGGNVSPCGWLIPVKSHVEYYEGVSQPTAINQSQIIEIDEQQYTNDKYSMQSEPNNQPMQINCDSSNDVQVEIGYLENRSGFIKLDAQVQNRDNSPVSAFSNAQILHLILQQVTQKLDDINSSLEDAIFVYLYVNDMSQFSEINKVYVEFFPPLNPPSRACVQLPLGYQSPIHVQIILQRNFGLQKQAIMNVLHVQSISEWAPSCIGPYSQCVRWKNHIYMAGQIPLDPATMQIISTQNQHLLNIQNNLKLQFDRSLLSCEKVAEAVSTDVRSCILRANVYCTQPQYINTLRQIIKQYLNNSDYFEIQGNCGSEGEDWYQDDYLKVVKRKRNWTPLITFFSVPALPKNALVEIQMELIDQKSYQFVDEGDDEDSEEEVESAPLFSFDNLNINVNNNNNQINYFNKNQMDGQEFVGQLSQKLFANFKNKNDIFSQIFYLRYQENEDQFILLGDNVNNVLFQNQNQQNIIATQILGQNGLFVYCFVGFTYCTQKLHFRVTNLLKQIIENQFKLSEEDSLGFQYYLNKSEEQFAQSLHQSQNLSTIPFDCLEFYDCSLSFEVVVDICYKRDGGGQNCFR